MILNVVFLKLFFELDRVKEIGVFCVILTIVVYFGLMFVFSSDMISRLIDTKLLDISQQTFQNILPLILIFTGPFLVVTFDYTFKKIVNMIRLHKG